MFNFPNVIFKPEVEYFSENGGRQILEKFSAISYLSALKANPWHLVTYFKVLLIIFPYISRFSVECRK